MTGVYGWYCEASCFDTRRERDGLPDEAATCDACAELFEGVSAGPCARCGAAVVRLGADGSWVDGGDRTEIESHWRERLLDDGKLAAFRKRYGTPEPEPTDDIGKYMAALEAWHSRFFLAYANARAKLEKDPRFIAEAEARVSPQMLAERVEQAMVGLRRYRCPRCRAFRVQRFAVPFPR